MKYELDADRIKQAIADYIKDFSMGEDCIDPNTIQLVCNKRDEETGECKGLRAIAEMEEGK